MQLCLRASTYRSRARSMSRLISPRSTRYRPNSTALQVLRASLYSESRSLHRARSADVNHGAGFLRCVRDIKGACTSKSPITTSLKHISRSSTSS
ncbi:unnamed protein product [Trichogramma brassicae]|uniref:Uncharacterized protein n=1 Tax=Trichogramma brassicae TaxID=86971 RepID=A0A6H5IP02_9HYME|nr:unnamed protein product [Trichogramma brassicae]